MATAEAETSLDERGPPGGSVYDGFISYSHAADDLLAPRLQTGLQRFAKPWWKRRALRMFRDEASLSANPHLWSSITEALDQSAWFVLLLSPEAADSEWVNREVEYWLEHKDADRIIPVVTDGEFRWAETDIDLESDAATPALYGAFSDEPRWVDLRFARSEQLLDLNNPRFSAAIADIASAIRGVPKDELESEEVRQHRRTVRTAWAAGAGLLILALLAAGAALLAFDQNRKLAEQSAIAERNAADAAEAAVAEEAAKEEAQQERDEAEAAQADAEQQAAIAQARELTLEAEKQVEFDPELSAHLALFALRTLRAEGENFTQAESALRAAVASDRVTFRVPGGDFVAIHPDGTLLATADVVENMVVGVAVWDIETRQVVERYSREAAIPTTAAFSPDGNRLAVGFEVDREVDAAEPAITIWERTTQDSLDVGPLAVGEFVLYFSPDGKYLAYEPVPEPGIWTTEVWSFDEGRAVFAANGAGPHFSVDGRLLYTTNPVDDDDVPDIVVVDPVSGQTLSLLSTSGLSPLFAEWSRDGTRIAFGTGTEAVVLDAESGTELVRAEVDRAVNLEWVSEDMIVFGGEATPKVVDANTGEVITELLGQPGEHLYGIQIIPGTTFVASAVRAGAAGFGAVIFETSPAGGSEVGGWVSPIHTNFSAGFVGDGSRIFLEDGDSHLTANALDGTDARVVPGPGLAPFFSGQTVEAPWFPDMDSNGTFFWYGRADGTYEARSFATDELIYEAPPGWSIVGVDFDGSQAVIKSGPNFCGTIRLVSTGDDTGFDLDSRCTGYAWFTPDGSLVSLGRGDADVLTTPVFDTGTGELLFHLSGTRYGGLGGAFTPDGTKLVMGGFSGLLSVLDVDTLTSGAPIDETAVDLEVQAHGTVIVRLPLSPDGTRALTSAGNEPLKLWDLTTETLLGSFGAGGLNGAHLGDFHPTEPWLMVTTPPNIVRIHTLDIDELIEIAESKLSRPMTDDECTQYFRGPCP